MFFVGISSKFIKRKENNSYNIIAYIEPNQNPRPGLQHGRSGGSK